jgi:plasmid maintenance system antidote protein VapI
MPCIFASSMTSEVSLILSGKRGITVTIALKLERLWGTNALVWMRLQVRYEIERIRIKYMKELKKTQLSPARKSAMKKQPVQARV